MLPATCVREKTTTTDQVQSAVSASVTETADIPMELPSGKTATAHYSKVGNYSKTFNQVKKKETIKRGGNRYLALGLDPSRIDSLSPKCLSVLGGLDLAGPLAGFITYDLNPSALHVFAGAKF